MTQTLKPFDFFTATVMVKIDEDYYDIAPRDIDFTHSSTIKMYNALYDLLVDKNIPSADTMKTAFKTHPGYDEEANYEQLLRDARRLHQRTNKDKPQGDNSNTVSFDGDGVYICDVVMDDCVYRNIVMYVCYDGQVGARITPVREPTAVFINTNVEGCKLTLRHKVTHAGIHAQVIQAMEEYLPITILASFPDPIFMQSCFEEAIELMGRHGKVHTLQRMKAMASDLTALCSLLVDIYNDTDVGA